MTNNYPNIMGIYLGMSLDEANKIVAKKFGYDKLKISLSDDNTYYVCSENNIFNPLYLNFSNDRLVRFSIEKWEDLFDFNNEYFNFTNIIEIFTNYFLKDFEFEILTCNGLESTLIKNEYWNISFINDIELITCYSNKEIL